MAEIVTEEQQARARKFADQLANLTPEQIAKLEGNADFERLMDGLQREFVKQLPELRTALAACLHGAGYSEVSIREAFRLVDRMIEVARLYGEKAGHDG